MNIDEGWGFLGGLSWFCNDIFFVVYQPLCDSPFFPKHWPAATKLIVGAQYYLSLNGLLYEHIVPLNSGALV